MEATQQLERPVDRPAGGHVRPHAVFMRDVSMRVVSKRVVCIALIEYAVLAAVGGWIPGIVWSVGSSAVARDIFPYRVFTVADETPVACGPGEAFYATDLLPAGVPLEVYRRDGQGWLAIRPPTRSFSWIPARKLHISADERVATVIADDAVAWVGSHVETVSDHRWQVRLDRGERLAILGHRQLADDKRGSTETWYQVEPPAGEFRWVHADDVSRHVGDRIEPAQYRADPLRSVSPRTEPSKSVWSPRSRPRSTTDERTTDTGLGPIAPTPLPVAGPAVTNELEELTLQLNALAQREPNLWNLGPLRARTEALIDSGSNALERGKARLMLEKIEEFEQLQQRHIRAERGLPPDEPAAARSTGAATNPTAPAGFDFISAGIGRAANSIVGTDRAPSGGATPRIEPRFDGTGWLLPVHSTKRVAPPYALLDDNGKVLQYVTPAPGLNLHRYERRRVGLYGQKTPAQSLNAPHLTAHRLVDLERHARK
jgi:hypothetical protein